ncbi:transposase family protein [Yersinia enterocolitica]|nr:transposase family protein [Yersinia enterocolitica]
MKVSTLGIDLAKNVFQLHGVGCNGQTVLKKKLTRDKFLPFLMQLEPCLIGMEACASSHHFARVLRQYGHEVKLIPPQYVKPYVKRIRQMPLMQKPFVKLLHGLICVCSD